MMPAGPPRPSVHAPAAWDDDDEGGWEPVRMSTTGENEGVDTDNGALSTDSHAAPWLLEEPEIVW